MQRRPYPATMRCYPRAPRQSVSIEPEADRSRVSHTDCGLSHTTDDALKTKLKERAGPEREQEVDAMVFGTIGK